MGKKTKTLTREELIDFVATWAWLNPECPAEIHDAAARILDQPTLAHGMAEQGYEKLHAKIEKAKDVAEWRNSQ